MILTARDGIGAMLSQRVKARRYFSFAATKALL